MADPTLETVAKFDDPECWDEVIDGVPIFTAHEAVDGDGKLKYKIDKHALQAVAASINRNWQKKAKPVKLFIGHTKDPKTCRQIEQPPLVGFAINARVGPWGPEQEPAILTKWFIRKGCKKRWDLGEFTERSPEFFPNTNEITAVALLKTDPRLNMGMVTMQRSDGAVLYMRGFDMPLAPEKKEHEHDITGVPGKPDEHYGEDEIPDIDEDGDEDLSPEEAEKFARYMKRVKYGKSKHHLMGLMKAHAKRYGLEMPSATNGTLPGAEEKKPDKVSMQRPDVAVHYELQDARRRLKVLEKAEEIRNQRYNETMARNTVTQLMHVERIKIANPEKLIERMSKTDDTGRDEIVADIRVNYAKRDEDEESIDLSIITAKGMLPTYRGPIEGGERVEEPKFEETDIDEAVRYCEEKHLDSSKPNEWDQAMKHVMAAKKEKAGKK